MPDDAGKIAEGVVNIVMENKPDPIPQSEENLSKAVAALTERWIDVNGVVSIGVARENSVYIVRVSISKPANNINFNFPESLNCDGSLLPVVLEEQVDYRKALQMCQEGRYTRDLLLLHQSHMRSDVPWSLFPTWARPN